MRISVCFTIGWLSGGGAERVMLNLIRELPKKDFDITIISIFKDCLPNDLSNIKYRWIFPRKFKGHVQLLKCLPQKLLYNWIVGKYNYDIVISYWEGVTMRIVGGKPNNKQSKIVNWIHNEFKTLSPIKRMFQSDKEFYSTLKKYDRTVFVAESARENLCEKLPDLYKTSHTIYNVIDSDEILRSSKEDIPSGMFDKNYFNIVSVGRLAEAKGFDRLIRIVRECRNLGIKVRLYLIGVGPLLSQLQQEAITLGVDDNVFFLGWQSNPYKFVSRADLFVCSSIHEGYSTAVSEALIVGTPVVSTLCSGMHELLGYNNEFGLVVENDETCLSNAVIQIINNRELQEDLKNKAMLRGEIFNKKNLVEQNIRFLKSLVKE